MTGHRGAGLIVVGVGCQSTCSGKEMITLVREALAACGKPASLVATVPSRADLPVIQYAAAALGIPLQTVDFGALMAVQSRCTTRSEAVRRATGLGSVAEAAALAAAGPGSRLLVPRIASMRATCAIAESDA